MSRALLACALAAQVAGAQVTDTSAQGIARFVSRARAATERFKEREVAVAESYVKVGPDFPAMGEHWVNGELIMRGELDPARPAILTYTDVNGRPTLTGVVYALALKRGESPPLLPTGAGWHDHVGSVDEESLLFHHDGHAGDDVRLVVMHAWIWQPNDAGMFVTDNWSLPFLRLGVEAPAGAARHADAARAAALLVGAEHYYDRLFESVGRLGEAERDGARVVVERHRAELARWWQGRAAAPRLSEAELAMLRDTWVRLTRDVQAAVGPTAASRLERLWSTDH